MSTSFDVVLVPGEALFTPVEPLAWENMQDRRGQCSPCGQATPVNRPSVENMMEYWREAEQRDLVHSISPLNEIASNPEFEMSSNFVECADKETALKIEEVLLENGYLIPRGFDEKLRLNEAQAT